MEFGKNELPGRTGRTFAICGRLGVGAMALFFAVCPGQAKRVGSVAGDETRREEKGRGERAKGKGSE